jgi:hypothetical protein
VGLHNGSPIVLTLGGGGNYKNASGTVSFDHAGMIAAAQTGSLLVTLTGELRGNVGKPNFPQPALSVPAVGDPLNNGRPDLPDLPGDNPMSVRGLHVHGGSTILVDGAPVGGSITCTSGSFSPICPAFLALTSQNNLNLQITLDQIPPSGTHVLQLQSPFGLLSNELPFTVQ